MVDNAINLENAKGAKELYLRNLSENEFNYIAQLQIKFQVKRGTQAARNALFGYLELEKKYRDEVEVTRNLLRELAALKNEFGQFKNKVFKHFELEYEFESSKNKLVEAVSTPFNY